MTLVAGQATDPVPRASGRAASAGASSRAVNYTCVIQSQPADTRIAAGGCACGGRVRRVVGQVHGARGRDVRARTGEGSRP